MKNNNITVISAFYNLKNSVYSIKQYKSWIRNLCKIPCYLIVFTTETYALEIYEERRNYLEKTHIIVKPFESFAMTCPSMMNLWKSQQGSYELYAMWSLKQELVRIAIHDNMFKSKWFVWCDIGIQRFSNLQDYYMTFPSDLERLCVPGRMAFLEVDRIPQSYINNRNESKPLEQPLPEIAIGSGCIVGDSDAWNEFGDAYKDMLKEFILRGWFAGKETDIFFAILMEKKTRPFRLFYAKQFVGIPGIEWLSFPVMLGGAIDAEIDMRFED
jgi:hypothetical protein